jgi:hypothetical protein
LLVPLLVCACGETAPTQKRSANEVAEPPQKTEPLADPEPTPAPKPVYPELPPIPEPSLPLDQYLAAIPSERPISSGEITGTAMKGDELKIGTCEGGWWGSLECEITFPKQGLLWLRWECMHADKPEVRNIACARLAEFIYEGVGGVKNRDFANALFDRECGPRKFIHSKSCCTAARTLVYDEPERALEFAKRVPEFSDLNPRVCGDLLREVEAGLKPRKAIVEEVTGLADVAVGSECQVWLWATGRSGCSARMACGDRVLYGGSTNRLACTDEFTAADPMTSGDDGDPVFRVDAKTIEVRDSESGRLGAFTLRGRVE